MHANLYLDSIIKDSAKPELIIEENLHFEDRSLTKVVNKIIDTDLIDISTHPQTQTHQTNLPASPSKAFNAHTISPHKEHEIKLSDKVGIFDTKPKMHDKPVLAKVMGEGANAKSNLINRMNKDKEPMKIIQKLEETPRPIQPVIEHEQVQEIHIEGGNDVEIVYKIETKPEDKAKLMKRIASAKGGMSKASLNNDKGMGKKQSEKIMGVAAMLERKIHQPDNQEKQINKLLCESPIKKAFFLSGDSDIQILDDEQSQKKSFAQGLSNMIMPRSGLPVKIEEPVDTDTKYTTNDKEVTDIIMEKPIRPFVKKIIRKAFDSTPTDS